MKRFLLSLIALACLISSPALAANCATTAFARTAGNWSGATTFNDASPGGVNCTLVAGNAVVFDANTGAGTYTIDASISIASFDASASPAVTLTHGGVTLTVVGNFTFNSTIIYQGINSARVVSMNPTGTNTSTITSAGQRFGALTVNGATGATVTLADALRVDVDTSSSPFTVTQGIFTANNQNVTAANFISNNSNTRTVTMGSGTWTITGNAVLSDTWTTNTTTGLTLTTTGSTLAFTYSGSSSARTFKVGTGQSFNVVTVAANTSGVSFLVNVSVTSASLAIAAPNTITIANNITWTISGASGLSITGSASNSLVSFITQRGDLGKGTISMASGSFATSWSAFGGMTFSGGATFSATSSFDLGGNTGITITAPATGGGRGIIGG